MFKLINRCLNYYWSNKFKKAWIESFTPKFEYSFRNKEWKINYKHYSGRSVKIREKYISDALLQNRKETEYDHSKNIPF